MRYILISLVFIGSMMCLQAQSAHKYNVEGDRAYDKSDFASAEENYLKAYNEKNSYQSKYNLGNSLYKQERYEEAIEAFDQATGMATQEKERGDSYYNLATAQLQNFENDPESLDQAISNFKKAIKYDPTNEAARKNLFYAQVMKRIKQKQEENQPQQQQQQQQQSQDQNQEQQEQQQDQEQDQQNQDQQEQENKENQSQEQEQQNPADTTGQSGQIDTISLEDLSKEEAERLLRIVEQEEKKIQDRLRRQQSNRNRPEKDW